MFLSKFFKRSLLNPITFISTNIRFQSFADKKKLYGCQKARDNYEELVLTMKKNIDFLQKSFSGKGPNYLSSSLNNLINIGLKDHTVVEEIVKQLNDQNAHLLIEESSQLQRLVEDLISLIEIEKYTKTVIKMLEEISNRFSLLKFSQIEKIKNNSILSKNHQVKSIFERSVIFVNNVKKYENISTSDLSEELFKLKGIKKASKNYELTSLDIEQCRFILFDKSNNQEVIIQGVGNSHEEASHLFKKLFQEKKGSINMLIVQDQPLPDFDQLENQSYPREIQLMYKTSKNVESLSGLQLRTFVINCFNEESFIFNFDTNEFKHKKLEVIENLSTLYIDFIRSAQSTRNLPCKVVLADMPIGEYINSLVLNQPLPKLQEAVRLCNFITLMEKCSFAHNTIFSNGCPKCNNTLFHSQINASKKKAPDAYLEILSGDDQYLPLKQKIQYFADKTYQTLVENKEYKRVLIACGSFQVWDVVKRIMENDDSNKDFDIYDFQKYKDELRIEFGKNSSEYLEKIALLEVLHEVIDNGCVRELLYKAKHQINLNKYVELIDYYTDLLSFECISPNVSFVSKKNVEKGCISDELIFGIGEDKEYVAQENKKEEIFSNNDSSSQVVGKTNQFVVEDTPKRKTKEEALKEAQQIAEEIKKLEASSNKTHHIDVVYDQDQKSLLKKIVDIINQKTLFIEDKLIEASEEESKQTSKQQTHKYKFKKGKAIKKSEE